MAVEDKTKLGRLVGDMIGSMTKSKASFEDDVDMVACAHGAATYLAATQHGLAHQEAVSRAELAEGHMRDKAQAVELRRLRRQRLLGGAVRVKLVDYAPEAVRALEAKMRGMPGQSPEASFKWDTGGGGFPALDSDGFAEFRCRCVAATAVAFAVLKEVVDVET